MARDVLAVLASRCSIERQFGILGTIATYRLKRKTISDLMIYKNRLKKKGVELRDLEVDIPVLQQRSNISLAMERDAVVGDTQD